MDIKANPTKYTNIESEWTLYGKIAEILKENFEISEGYLIKKEQAGEDAESDMLNYE